MADTAGARRLEVHCLCDERIQHYLDLQVTAAAIAFPTTVLG